MPSRTVNFTGRQRLNHADVRIVLREEGTRTVFDAWFDLGNYSLPASASVYVEAYRQARYMRFQFGQVGSIHPPHDRRLADFDSPVGVLFRVKVVSASDPRGLLLAEADRLRPVRAGDLEDERIPLLPVAPSPDLAHEVYRLEFDGNQVLLLVNDRLENWQSLARDPLFAALVYPSALRAILTRILHIERRHDTEDPGDWRSCWLRFATMLPGVEEPPGEDEESDFDDWIDEAVAAFCRRGQLFDRFEKGWSGGER